MRDGPEHARAALRYVAEDARSGYGDAADRLVRGMREAGARVEYRGWSGGFSRDAIAGLRPHSRDSLIDEHAPEGAPTIAHLVPEHYPMVRQAVGSGPLLGHTVWETDRLPSHWPELLNQADRIIVPTEWNRSVFVESGVEAPVVVVPYVACDPVPGDGGVALELPDDVVVFYTIARWGRRNAPDLTLRAFLEAFTADDPVVLVIKTTPRVEFIPGEMGSRDAALAFTTMFAVARILRDHPNPPRVRVDVDVWERARIAGLHTRGDCYVSLTHGEGWGLGAFDAAAHGNPVVMTGWGGQRAYLDAERSFLVDYDLEPVSRMQSWSYTPDQHWAEPRVEHAVDLLREVAADLDAARRRAAPLRDRLLREYSPERVVGALLESVPELTSSGAVVPVPRPRGAERIPRVAHFVWGLRDEPEPFHLVHALAIRSCLEVVAPDEIIVRCHHLPYGPYWDLVEPFVRVERVEPARSVLELDYPDASIRRYAYAHHADVVRLDVLGEYGGLYADLDTLFVAPIPDHLWSEEFVIGREADVTDGEAPAPRPALSNAVLMSAPGSAFIEAWRSEIEGALDGSWAEHSCFLAQDLAMRLPGDVHVEPQRTFHAFEPSPAGIALLLEHAVRDLEGVVALHLAAHLWWSEGRLDFSSVHAGLIDEEWVRASPSTYAIAARRFLPHRGVRV